MQDAAQLKMQLESTKHVAGAGMCFIVRRHVKKLIGKFIRRVATSEEVVHGISVPKKCCARNIQCHHVILE